jgi:glycosyltransferase involved in cell wall biosynthesis
VRRRLIAVDARGYFTGGGIGRYTRNLVGELATAGAAGLRLLISNRHRPSDLDLPAAAAGVEVVVSRAEWMNAEDETRFLEEEVAGADLFHSLTGHWLPRRTRSVATLLDFTPMMHPRLVSAGARQLAERIAATIPAAAHVIAISRATADDARAVLGMRLPPLSVVHLAAAPQFRPDVPSGNVLTRFGLLARGFVLAASALNAHKNLERLVDAYAAAGIEPPLVIVGAHRDAAEAVRASIARHGLGTRVRLIGRVTDEDLAALYATCRMFVYPSLYEGFGLPVAEAMACGAAVIASNRSSLPEVAGDAALLADATRTAPLAAALRRLDQNPSLRSDLRRRALARAAAFSWRQTAADTLEVYGLTLDARAAA